MIKDAVSPLLDPTRPPGEKFLRGFPSTRYQGSKRKLLPWIFDKVRRLEFDSALDVFGGSGIVSYLFKRMGKQTIYNDFLRFNYLIGKSLIENASFNLTRRDISTILRSTKQSRKRNFIAKNFSRIYYRAHENRWIDSTLFKIQTMNHYQAGILEQKKALAYYCLFQSCLVKRPFNLFHRKNLNIRNRRVERSFGNMTTWNTRFERHFDKFADEINRFTFSNGKKNRATNYSASDIPKFGVDLVYIDPPYLMETRRDKSDYESHYHFLEGMSRTKEWPQLIDYESLNRRIKSPHNPWMDKERSIEEFRILFKKFKNSILVVSYRNRGIPSVRAIKRALVNVKGKGRVRVYSQQHSYALKKPSDTPSPEREILFIAE